MHRSKRPTPLRDSPLAFIRPARRRGLIDRMLGRSRPDLAARALQNLLAQRDPTQVTTGDISALLLEFAVGGPEARAVLVEMWRKVLTAFLADDEFSDREIAYLGALREAFALTDEEVRNSERDVVHPRFAIALRDALADSRVTDEERDTLARLAAQLRLPEEVQQELYNRSSRAVIERLLDRSTADRRLSPDELEQLVAVARQLGVDRKFDQATEAMLDRYTLFWRIENGDLPTVIVEDLPLDGDETCHAVMDARHYRPRGVPDSGEEGIGGVRIARGVYYRAGSSSDERINTGLLDRVGVGRLLITSKRVLFLGKDGSSTIPLREVSSYQVYADGIVLERRASLGMYFTLVGDVELAAVVLGAALARA